MAIAFRRLIAGALALGIVFAVAPDDAPAFDHARLTAPSPSFALGLVDWTVDVPDFIAPDAIAVPDAPAAALVAETWRAPKPSARVAEVLRLAPKTSPPRG